MKFEFQSEEEMKTCVEIVDNALQNLENEKDRLYDLVASTKDRYPVLHSWLLDSYSSLLNSINHLEFVSDELEKASYDDQ